MGPTPWIWGYIKLQDVFRGGVYFVLAFFANLGNQERNHLEFIRVYT